MKTLLLPGLLLLIMISSARSQTPERIATALLAELGPEKAAKMTTSFDSGERTSWHFVPKDRFGIRLKEMSAKQQQQAFALVNLCLSVEGARKAKGVVALESILREVEKRQLNDTYRDSGNFYFAVFGVPDGKAPWGLRMEGHHVSLNFTIYKGQVLSAAPGFLGANPAIVPEGPAKGHQLLKEETVLAFALVNGLSDSQQQVVVVATKAPADIITGNKRNAWQLEPPGIAWQDLKPEQQRQLRALIDVYIGRYTRLMKDILWKEIESAGTGNIRFAWAGGKVWGEGHYYRIQGPTFLIEYDNTQNNGNHVHSVFRELKNDFGDDALKEHYKTAHR